MVHFSAYVGGWNCGGQVIVEKYSANEQSYQGVVASAYVGAGNVHNKPSNYLDAPSGYFERGVAQDTKRVLLNLKLRIQAKCCLFLGCICTLKCYCNGLLCRPPNA